MDQSLEVPNVKIEPTNSTTSDQVEISSEMLVENVKQEGDYLIHSELDIKIESHQDKSEFPIITSTSYNMCSNFDIEIKTDGSVVKIEYENILDKILQDPLDDNSEIKDKTTLNEEQKMDKEESSEIKNILNKSNIGAWEIPIETGVDSINKENVYSLHTELGIKIEAQEYESEYVAGTCNEIYRSDDVKVETMDELMGKMDEIKDKQYFSIDLDRPWIKIEPIKRKKDQNLLETENALTRNDSNQGRDRLLIRNYSKRIDKKYICKECNKTFTQKSTLNTHLRIHTGEKPYTCDICKKSFSVKSALNKHLLIHSGEKPHGCDICKKVFSQKSVLNKHKLIHSGMKAFSCDECDKSFVQKQNLIAHKRIHTGEKPYSCDVCEKAFSHKPDLNNHKRIHTGEKPYSCDICNKSFTRNSNLKQHKKLHNN